MLVTPCALLNTQGVDREEKRRRIAEAGAWLRQERRRRGFPTGQAFADALGIGQSLLSKYELGVNEVPDERIEQIAKVLEMDIVEVRRGLGSWVPDDVPSEPEEREESLAERARRIEAMVRDLVEDIEQEEGKERRRGA